MLYQFAIMGATFSKNVLGIEHPRVAVLNIGEEAGKGNELAQATYKLLEEQQEKINFVGNIEGKEIFLSVCDVVVCDGLSVTLRLKLPKELHKCFSECLNKNSKAICRAKSSDFWQNLL